MHARKPYRFDREPRSQPERWIPKGEQARRIRQLALTTPLLSHQIAAVMGLHEDQVLGVLQQVPRHRAGNDT